MSNSVEPYEIIERPMNKKDKKEAKFEKTPRMTVAERF